MSEQKISEMVRRAIQNSQGQIDDMLDDCMEEAINKAERAMDRVTNEKMSAISEYSDTVMNDIHKNHDEVMFMYDMLNDKHKNLKNTVSEVDRVAKEAKQTAKEVAETTEHAEAATRELTEKKAEAATREFTENKVQRSSEFSSLTDILDRADAVAAAKTQNKVIRSENYSEMVVAPQREYVPTYIDTEYQQAKAPVAEQAVSYESAPDNSYQNANNNAYEKGAEEYDADDMSYFDEDDENDEMSNILEPVGEDSFKEGTGASGGNLMQDQEIVQNNELAQPVEIASLETENSAKVVSLAEASRKKAQAEVPQEAQNINNPASRNQRILDMHKAGKSAVVIARELRLGIGEVKLVIDLAGKHKKTRSSII
ncbi:DUF6115 domain-containing protein [Butyrivibrio sp. NC2002]|uniref:DUF6115 domain-containing protein n=1 Tax=Butyrivibrio sp. NC2002 TaxID=1410610 RepID=UPI0018CC66ED|nr:DUF6115 domain-containing protein [Butyrivibrio sp. NC2002]